jgi:hypothetical protein
MSKSIIEVKNNGIDQGVDRCMNKVKPYTLEYFRN